MTIEFHNVLKRVRKGHIKTTYQNLDIIIGDGERVALLGQKEAGMESILELICHADAPDSGKVIRTSSISWPIPSSRSLQKHISLAANTRFIARLYGVDEKEFLDEVIVAANLGEYVNRRADMCPKDVLSRLNFCLGVCLKFDHYILTSSRAGGKGDRERFEEIVDNLRQRAGLVLVGQDGKGAVRFCDSAYVFDGQQAIYYTDVEAAADHLKQLATKGEDVEFDEDPDDAELRDLVNVDF